MYSTHCFPTTQVYFTHRFKYDDDVIRSDDGKKLNLTEYFAFLLKSFFDLSLELMFRPFIETGKILIRGDAVAMVLSVEQDSEKWRKNGFFPPFSLLCLCTSFWYISESNIFLYTVEQDSCQIGPLFFNCWKKICKNCKKVCQNTFLHTAHQDFENGAQTGQIQSPCFPSPDISLFPLSFGNI